MDLARRSIFFLVFWLVCLSGAVAQHQPILLWPDGAPGSEGKIAPEADEVTPDGEHSLSSIHHPSITPYLPAKGIGNGAAVIIAPGGGHYKLSIDSEGYNVARWFSAHGVAAFVLKYRLALEKGSTYTVEGDELADIQRALRTVRSRSSEWGIDRDRIGVMGFSAGGELALLASTRSDGGLARAKDAIDRETSKPAFQVLMYPGGLPTTATFTKETPPTFLLCGEDDRPNISQGVPELYLALRRAGASAEMHIFSGVGHGFGLRFSNRGSMSEWPLLVLTWMDTKGFLKQKQGIADVSVAKQ
jgi:acetyl esterase/lipase